MEIVIDGRRGWGTKSHETTLGAVLEVVHTHIGARRVVDVVLDGESLSRNRQQQVREQRAGRFTLLEVKTVDPVRLGRDTLAGIQALLARLQRSHEEAARSWEDAEFGRAIERLKACANAWDTLSRALRDVAALLSVEMSTLEWGGLSGDVLVRRLSQTLVRIRGALECPDVVRLSELANEELRPALAHWKALIDQLADRLTGVSPPHLGST